MVEGLPHYLLHAPFLLIKSAFIGVVRVVRVPIIAVRAKFPFRGFRGLVLSRKGKSLYPRLSTLVQRLYTLVPLPSTSVNSKSFICLKAS